MIIRTKPVDAWRLNEIEAMSKKAGAFGDLLSGDVRDLIQLARDWVEELNAAHRLLTEAQERMGGGAKATLESRVSHVENVAAAHHNRLRALETAPPCWPPGNQEAARREAMRPRDLTTCSYGAPPPPEDVT